MTTERLEALRLARELLGNTLDEDFEFWSAPQNARYRRHVYGAWRALNDAATGEQTPTDDNKARAKELGVDGLGGQPSWRFVHVNELATALAEAEARGMERSIGAEFEAEYHRQINDEGYDPSHDDLHREGELACAAIAYAMPEWLNEWMDKNDIKIWPFEGHPKFKDRRRDLIRAGALLIAEIARLDREVAVALLPAEPAGSE